MSTDSGPATINMQLLTLFPARLTNARELLPKLFKAQLESDAKMLSATKFLEFQRFCRKVPAIYQQIFSSKTDSAGPGRGSFSGRRMRSRARKKVSRLSFRSPNHPGPSARRACAEAAGGAKEERQEIVWAARPTC